MKRLIARLAAGILTLSATLLGLTGPAHAADPTGSISGHVTNGGQPEAAFVILYDSACRWLDSQNTDASGLFSFANLNPGQYKLEFLLDNGLDQWYHQKLSCQDADAVTVTAGADTAVEETPVPTGTISGHLTDSTGAPVANAQVTALK